MAKLKTMVL